MRGSHYCSSQITTECRLSADSVVICELSKNGQPITGPFAAAFANYPFAVCRLPDPTVNSSQVIRAHTVKCKVLFYVKIHVKLPQVFTFLREYSRKFWENQDVRYNWKADILFTGSRSKVELIIFKYYFDFHHFWIFLYNGLDIEVYDLRTFDLHYYYYVTYAVRIFIFSILHSHNFVCGCSILIKFTHITDIYLDIN